MPEIAVNRYRSTILPVIEDPNPNKNRIFINAQTFDLNTLAPYWMSNWHFTNDEVFTGINNNTDWGAMLLTKGTIQCWSNGDALYYAINMQDTQHVGLDNANYPARKMWRTAAGNHVISIPPGGAGYNDADSGLTNYFQIYTSEVLNNATYTQSGAYSSHILHEDTTNNRMWGMLNNNADGTKVQTWTSYNTTVGGLARVWDTDGYMAFFLGVDNVGWPYFVFAGTNLQVSTGTQNYFQVYKYNPVSTAGTQLITNSNRGLTTQHYLRGFPSNVRRDTNDRRVFYSCHFDASSVFAPIRYVFDAAAGSVTATNCTMTYQGSDTYATHAERYTAEGASTTGQNSWFMKGHQFTVSGVNYITFWICEMASNYGSSATRWNTAKKRTMLTYTIGSGTGDDVLTFHSKVEFPGITAMPRNFMPINSTGTHVVVPVAGLTKFYTFNSGSGWTETSTYPAEFRQLGLDSTNRLWGTSTERGFHTVHMIAPSTPVTVSVVLASPNYTYTGTNITTTATVNAYDSNGNRVVASINLTIEGSTMVFTSNSLKNITLSTSSSADTSVSLTISGGGINNIIASVNF